MKLHELVSTIKKLAKEKGGTPTKNELYAAGVSEYSIRANGGMNSLVKAAGLDTYLERMVKALPDYEPKILVFDIETAPILAYVWGLFDQNVGLNQIHKDWHVMSWAAKWVGQKEVFQHDQRSAKNIEDDSKILKVIWSLLDEADIVLTQNGIKFDAKKLNARFVAHGFPPPSSYRHIDTRVIAKRYFSFTSNKLEYLTHTFNKKYKKLKHAKFAGFELWSECLKGNLKAWDEMAKYNKYDVLALEELYLNTLRKWDKSINYNAFSSSFNTRCSCGSQDLKFHKKPKFTNLGKFSRYICQNCGQEHFTRINELSKEKRKTLTN
jgi:uncharacterized protein YprB with RNaseH-like and TPR domain